jgi:hypothetical protein
MRLTRLVLFSIVVVAISASAVFAQNSRTFVSGSGLDSNPCSLAAPCRTMTQALSVTNAGGEVVILSTAGYGPFTVSQAVTIEAPPGIYAGITATSGDGIDVSANANDVVTLRGFTVTNQNTISTGIAFKSGGTLNIENCVVDGFTSSTGIGLYAPGNTLVKDTVVRNNGFGFFVDPMTTGTAMTITMDHVRVDGNGIGFFVVPGDDTAATVGAVNAVIRNSSISNNSNGVDISPQVGVVSVKLERCLIANNSDIGIGVNTISPASASVTISNCTLSRNAGVGFHIGLGTTIFSRGNNIFIGNAPNSGTLTLFPAQ